MFYIRIAELAISLHYQQQKISLKTTRWFCAIILFFKKKIIKKCRLSNKLDFNFGGFFPKLNFFPPGPESTSFLIKLGIPGVLTSFHSSSRYYL